MSTACFSPATAARCLVGQFLAAAAMIGMGDSGVSSLPRAQQRSILSEGKAQAAFQPRGPAQFFTINEVNSGTNSSARAIRLSFDYTNHSACHISGPFIRTGGLAKKPGLEVE